jgi:hypothetical protein
MRNGVFRGFPIGLIHQGPGDFQSEFEGRESWSDNSLTQIMSDATRAAMRAGRKEGTDDALKAQHYLQKLREVKEWD